MIRDLQARVHDYVRRHGLIAPGQAVVVAVSGGADSLCLLHALRALAPALECRLYVAHLDHALRAASPADAAFVAAHAAEMGLPCTVERRDVPALARARRLSLEAAARAARHDFLHEVAATVGAARIASGHTRDDQAETLLLHLLRGSGLNGLAGMRPLHGKLIRPLLEVSHAEAVACCAELSLAPREDESNRSPAHRRNRLRHEVMPRLDAIQPAASANLARAARLLAADLSLVERLAHCALEAATAQGLDGRAALSPARWAQAEPELRPHMLRLLLARLLGSADGFNERHYAAMLRVIEPGAPDTALALPRGLVLERRGDTALLGPPLAPLAPLATYDLNVPGCVHTEAGLLRAELDVAPREWAGLSPRVAYLDPGAAGPLLCVRAWRRGDRVRPLGLHGTRKVHDVFVDRKVPRALRCGIPVVEGPRGIAWVAGLCLGEPYRAIPGAPAVKLTWTPVEA